MDESQLGIAGQSTGTERRVMARPLTQTTYVLMHQWLGTADSWDVDPFWLAQSHLHLHALPLAVRSTAGLTT